MLIFQYVTSDDINPDLLAGMLSALNTFAIRLSEGGITSFDVDERQRFVLIKEKNWDQLDQLKADYFSTFENEEFKWEEQFEKIIQRGEIRTSDYLFNALVNQLNFGELVTILAPTNIGKTAFLVNIASDLVRQDENRNVCFISLELPMGAIASRFFANSFHYYHSNFQKNENWTS